MVIEMRSINLPTISGKYRLQLFERGQLLVVFAIANSPNRKEKKTCPIFIYSTVIDVINARQRNVSILKASIYSL